ncbi:glycosyl transferase, group 1 [Pseudogulbenkiania sp. NH8B]|uniref:glycosyltransferase family 4 protein n=1 Tax=Pseudogulbenkiania sp. (strain NH8B) TaxID=748280 RepID=UPI000227A826|nr:glycosyltransferase family 4 protein [Pseudogulbenkiania sp. NH8B]BAK78450.1 glycosyl transferase, group 1 [Pseudogulbenkiania sp. NH8B]
MAERLTILHTESSLGWGGQEHRTFKEMVGLRKLGQRLLLACQPGAKFAVRAREAGFEVFEVRMRNGVDLAAVAKLAALMRRERVDVVNTHSGRDSILGGLAGRMAGRLVVRTRHLALPITSRFTYTTLPHYVVSVSEHVRRYLEGEGVPQHRIGTIYTGIDPEAMVLDGASTLRAELGLPDSAKLVGTVAILRKKKGHQRIVEAAPAILAACPDAHFVFAGDGPQLDNLKAQIAAAGLNERFHLLGLRRDIANVLAGCDLFLLPTEQEALGTSFIEAMAMGLPVIGTRVDGVPEVVRHDDNGLLIEPDDVASLAAAVIRLLGDDPLHSRMAARSRELVSSVFHVDTMCRDMLALYRRLLAARGKR